MQRKKSTKGNSASCRTVGIYYVNVNGYKSKRESINQLIEECNTDILLLTETKVYSETAVKVERVVKFFPLSGQKTVVGVFWYQLDMAYGHG